MCSLKVVTMLALHHKEPSHLYCHSSVGFVLFVLLDGFSDRGISVCGSQDAFKTGESRISSLHITT